VGCLEARDRTVDIEIRGGEAKGVVRRSISFLKFMPPEDVGVEEVLSAVVGDAALPLIFCDLCFCRSFKGSKKLERPPPPFTGGAAALLLAAILLNIRLHEIILPPAPPPPRWEKWCPLSDISSWCDVFVVVVVTAVPLLLNGVDASDRVAAR